MSKQMMEQVGARKYRAAVIGNKVVLLQSIITDNAKPGLGGYPSYTLARASKVIPEGYELISLKLIKELFGRDYKEAVKKMNLKDGVRYWTSDTARNGRGSAIDIENGDIVYDEYPYMSECTVRIYRLVNNLKKIKQLADVDINAD